MASNDPSRLTSQWVALLQDNPQRDAIWSCVTNAPNATVFAEDPEIKADLPDKDKHLSSFSGAVEYSSFTHEIARDMLNSREFRLALTHEIGSTKRLKGTRATAVGCMPQV